MDFKVFIWLGLSLTLAPTLVTTDLHVAQVQNVCQQSCHIHNSTRYGDGRKPPTPQEIAEIENLVKSGRATTDKYLLLGYIYKELKKFDLAQERYSTGLDRAKKAGDLKEQAIALEGLGEVFAATGRRQAAASRLTEARTLYIKLGDQQSVNEVNQQLTRIRLSN